MKKRIFAHLRKWHRWLGISAAVFILLLSTSGIFLNHSDQFGFPQRYVNLEFIWDLYGIKEPEKTVAFKVSDTMLIAVDEQLWLGNKLLLSDVNILKSAVYFKGFIVVILNQDLLLLTADGDIIERMNATAVIPEKINSLAITADKIWIQADSAFYFSDEQLLQWQLSEIAFVADWANPVELSKEQYVQASKNFRSHLISWERVLLDFHSGRIFGVMGSLFSDLVALLLILLSISGIALWLRNSRKKISKKKVNN